MNAPLGRLAGTLVLAFLFAACSSKEQPSESVRSAADDTAAEHAIKHTNPKYRCPMHPQIVRDEPGQCPICGMNLVKVEEEEPAATGRAGGGAKEVRISPAVINNLGVRTEPVVRGSLSRTGQVVGYVEFDERRVQQVRPRAEGWVEGLSVRAMGEPVRKGQLLFTLYSPMLESAQQEYLDALKIGNADLIDASRDRLRALGLDSRTVARLASGGRAAGRVSFHAPIAGVVTELEAREGAMLTPDM
ncbi:MAG TPA: efflux RND transporter periplasmic adaptor subunit, partial [Steroidobacteraceae bacterium]|nr:efflux RND transporter periplasmic adaptor subunit [Steroidobacteraceae bacterium]